MKDIIIFFFFVLIFYYGLQFVINCLTKELRNKQIDLLNKRILIEGLDVEMATNVNARTSAIQERNYQNLANYKAQRAEKEVGDAGAGFDGPGEFLCTPHSFQYPSFNINIIISICYYYLIISIWYRGMVFIWRTQKEKITTSTS